MHVLIPALLMVSGFLLTSCRTTAQRGTAAVPPLDLDELDVHVEAAMSSMEVPGLALVVVDETGIVIAKGYGVRALDSSARVDADTLFEIASVTKTFTATAVALLVDDGELTWSTPIAEHIPAFSLESEFVTGEFNVADALSHRAGYVDNEFYDLFPDMERSDYYERLSHSRSAHPFRTGFEYNNALFQLAGDLIPVLTGQTWSDFVDERLLNPLAMHATYMDRSALDENMNYSIPHVLTKDGMVAVERSPHDVDHVQSAGSMLSTANDMAKWLQFQLHPIGGGVDGLSLSDSTLQAMRTVQISGTFDWFHAWGFGRQRAGYGLGWKLHDYRDDADQHVSHGGAFNGMQTWMVLSPKHGYGIVIMSNGGWAGDRVHFAIANWIHDRYLGLEPIDWVGERLPDYRREYDEWLAEQDPKRPDNFNPPTDVSLRAYCGTFDHAMYGPMLIELNDDGVLEVQMGKLRCTAQPWSGETFRLDWGRAGALNGTVTFTVRADGTVTGLTYDDGMEFVFNRRQTPH